VSGTPIEDYLDDLLRRSHAAVRTTRRLLDEAGDHLFAAAADYEAGGMTRVDAERQAVRQFGPVSEVLRGSWVRSFVAMLVEVVRAAILLVGCGLVAVGLSGGVVAAMNAAFGLRFVGGATTLGSGGHAVAETAHDAVSLRLLAGLVGVLIVAGSVFVRRRVRPEMVLPVGLVDGLGAAAFAAATAVLAVASIEQGRTGVGGHGVGFFLSGAVISVIGAVVFCTRATRTLIPGH
jgi:hypothetical protein